MKKNKIIFVLLLLVSITVVSTCGTFFYVKQNKNNNTDSTLLVMTSCNPVYLATSNIVAGIDGVKVQNLSQPTTGCLHDYTLTTEDMKNLSKADVLVVNGSGMEGYLADVVKAYPDLPVIDSTSDMNLENSHSWLSEDIYQKQVVNIGMGLAKIDSANTDAYAANVKEYCRVISERVDKQGLDADLKGQNVAILHEAFEYTADSLGANVVAVMDLDEERQVSAGEVSSFIDSIKSNDVKIVFAEYDYGNAMGKLITEQTDAKVVYLETLVHGSYSDLDYITVLNKNYATIKNSL